MHPVASSYRDPAGFVFKDGDLFYRYIAPNYFANYDLLLSSGLYDALTAANRLVRHEEVKDISAFQPLPGEHGKIILPEQIPFISYPYEWSFDMWRDAAIVTLKIAEASLEKNMMLKDATPFNIQFYKGRPVFIDTLSFEKYEEGQSWVAYRQFCECFLGPLLLMHYGHRDAGKLFLSYPEGIPVDMVRSLLPRRSKWNLHAYLHIWLHAKVSAKEVGGTSNNKPLPKAGLTLLFKGLISFVEKLRPEKSASEWGKYYEETILGDDYLQAKKRIVEDLTKDMKVRRLIDLGANDGVFSLLLKDRAEYVIATDADSICINELYRKIRKDRIKNIVPLVSALHNPSPAIGWGNAERASLTERFHADLILALALVHHLAITANLSLQKMAERFSEMCDTLVIEFVPRTDEKVKLLLKNREDDFPRYNIESFRDAFGKYFNVAREEKAGNTNRIIFLMQKK